jgi:outer membrane protein TolC
MHRSTRLLILLPVLFGLQTILHGQTGGERFPLPETYFPGLKDLIDAASKQSPRIMARNTENAVAEANRIIARSSQLPSVSLSGSYYPWVKEVREESGKDVTYNPEKLAYYFSISQPVYHWGALRNNTRIAEIQQKITEDQSAEAHKVLIDEIRAQYLQVIVSKAALARATFDQKLADDALALARSKLEKNVISSGDMFGPTISAEQYRLAADRAVVAYENSRVYLGKLCGTPPLNDDQVPTAVPPITPALSALQSVVAEFTGQSEPDTYSLEVLRDQILAEQLTYKVVDARLRPKLNVVAGISQDEHSYTVNLGTKYNVQSTYAGISVSWSIFDGFATRSLKRNSLARRRQLERNYEEQSTTVIEGVRNQMKQLEFAARDLEIVEKMLGSAEGYVGQRTDEMRRGVVSDAEVNAARSAFYTTQMSAFGARNQYLMLVAKLLSTTQNDPALPNPSTDSR